MKILGGWFKKALPPQNSAQNPQQSLMQVVAQFAAGQGRLQKDYAAGVSAQCALKNIAVFRCVNKIASAVQAVQWEAQIDSSALPKEQEAAKKELDDFQELLSSPSPGFTGAELRYWLASTLALFGCAPLKAGVSGQKMNALYPLRADKLARLVDRYGTVTGYDYGDAGLAQSMPARAAAKNEAGALAKPFAFEISKPDMFLRPDKFVSPLEALSLPAQIMDNLLARAYDLADGTPNLRYILFSEDPLPEELNESIREDIDSRKSGVNAPRAAENNGFLFLDGVKLGKVELKSGLEDLQNKVPMDDMSRAIAGLFGIPVALLGLAAQDSSKFANNYSESRLSFWEDTIIPEYLMPIEAALTRNICPPGIKICFDRDSIPALFDKRLSAAAVLEKISFLSDDEKREACGYAPLKEKARAKGGKDRGAAAAGGKAADNS